MPAYLLDTDILTLYQHKHPKVLTSIASHRHDSIHLSTVTIEEQLSGWSGTARSAKDHSQQEVASRLLGSMVRSWCQFSIVLSSVPAMLRFDQLVKAKLNVGRFDFRIASIALELGAAVVTRNRRDFGRIPGLVLEDWSV